MKGVNWIKVLLLSSHLYLSKPYQNILNRIKFKNAGFIICTLTRPETRILFLTVNRKWTGYT